MSTKAYLYKESDGYDLAGTCEVFTGSELSKLFDKYSEEYEHVDHYITRENLDKMLKAAKIEAARKMIQYWIGRAGKSGQVEFSIG